MRSATFKVIAGIGLIAVLWFPTLVRSATEKGAPMKTSDVTHDLRELCQLQQLTLADVEKALGSHGIKPENKNEAVQFYKGSLKHWSVDLRLPLPSNQGFNGFLVLTPLTPVKIQKSDVQFVSSRAVTEEPHFVTDTPVTGEVVFETFIHHYKISVVVDSQKHLKFVAIDPLSDSKLIPALETELNSSGGMWSNGVMSPLNAPESTPVEEVVKKIMFSSRYDHVDHKSLKILEKKKITIDGTTYDAVLFSTNLGKWIALLKYNSKEHYWWNKMLG